MDGGAAVLAFIQARLAAIEEQRRGFRAGFAAEDPLGDLKAGDALAEALGFPAGAAPAPPVPAAGGGRGAGGGGGGGEAEAPGRGGARGSGPGGQEAGPSGSGSKKRARGGKGEGGLGDGGGLPVSGFRGVVFKSVGCYQAKIATAEPPGYRLLGSYQTGAEAARVYDAEVRVQERARVASGKAPRARLTNFESEEAAEEAVREARALLEAEEEKLDESKWKQCAHCPAKIRTRQKKCPHCHQEQGNSTKFNGVAKRVGKKSGRTTYQAKIWVKHRNEMVHLNTYHLAEEAARERDRELVKQNGEEADLSKLNFPTEEAADEAVRKAWEALKEANGGKSPPRIVPRVRRKREHE